jgi:hypothetical protein
MVNNLETSGFEKKDENVYNKLLDIVQGSNKMLDKPYGFGTVSVACGRRALCF